MPTRRIRSSRWARRSLPPAAASPSSGSTSRTPRTASRPAPSETPSSRPSAPACATSRRSRPCGGGVGAPVRRVPPGAGRVLAFDDRRLPQRRRCGRVDRRRAPARPLRAVSEEQYRSGVVALAGRPNVGKSTLVNALVGEHVATVSATPQTTRRRALGVVSRPGYQLILADLPGFQKPFDRLTERMQRAVDAALADADATVLMLDGRVPIGPGDRYIAERLLRPGVGAVRDRREQDRRPRAGPGAARARGGGRARRRTVDPSGERAQGRRRRGAPRRRSPRSCLAGPAYFPDDVTTDQPVARPHRGAGARAGASAHA